MRNSCSYAGAHRQLAAFAVILVAGCAGAARPVTDADRQVVRGFEERVGAYAALRANALRDLDALVTTRDASQFRDYRLEASSRIRAARPDAHAGDILTPDVAEFIRDRVASVAASHPRVIDPIKETAPTADAIELGVNAPYPTTAPFSRMPARLLRALPPLPKPLEYRFVGHSLILLDQPANLIIDFMRDALPAGPLPRDVS